ncbi:MAG: hypothetical protein JXR91_10615, partial [Deltaproteobacteria bacterium]|nr:hypothetical protein [Deltaproteobacteria bacterium]
MFRYRRLYYIFFTTFVFFLIGSTSFAEDPHITAKTSIDPQSIFVNEYAEVNISLKIPTGFHLYSMLNIDDGPIPLSVKINSESLSAAGNFFGSRPEVKFDEGFEKNIEYYNNFASFKLNV